MNDRTRKTTRLPGYDYNQLGSYFLTVCTENRERTLSRIRLENGSAVVELLPPGVAAEQEIRKMNEIYSHLRVDKYVIMPDHVHLLLTILEPELRNASQEAKNSVIAKYVGTFKRFCNRKCGKNLWQPRSYDHIIRDQADYDIRWEYIENNPMSWILTGKTTHPSPP